MKKKCVTSWVCMWTRDKARIVVFSCISISFISSHSIMLHIIYNVLTLICAKGNTMVICERQLNGGAYSFGQYR